jgi:hypothetical protein
LTVERDGEHLIFGRENSVHDDVGTRREFRHVSEWGLSSRDGEWIWEWFEISDTLIENRGYLSPSNFGIQGENPKRSFSLTVRMVWRMVI